MKTGDAIVGNCCVWVVFVRGKSVDFPLSSMDVMVPGLLVVNLRTAVPLLKKYCPVWVPLMRAKLFIKRFAVVVPLVRIFGICRKFDTIGT